MWRYHLSMMTATMYGYAVGRDQVPPWALIPVGLAVGAGCFVLVHPLLRKPLP